MSQEFISTVCFLCRSSDVQSVSYLGLLIHMQLASVLPARWLLVQRSQIQMCRDTAKRTQRWPMVMVICFAVCLFPGLSSIMERGENCLLPPEEKFTPRLRSDPLSCYVLSASPPDLPKVA